MRLRNRIALSSYLYQMSSLSKGGGVPPWGPNSLIAWGDSLTAGTGSTSGHSYPALLNELFASTRTITNRGIGGQSSTQIAARQGGVPIMVDVSGNEIPAFTPTAVYTADFEDGADGWTQQGFNGASAVAIGGKLVVTSGTNPNISGAGFNLVLSAGDAVRLQGTISNLEGGAQYVQGGLRGGGSGWNGTPGSNTGGERVIDETYVATRDASDGAVALLFMPTSATAGRKFQLDNVTITVTKADGGGDVLVSNQTVNVLFQSGTYQGSMYGTIDGIHGNMTTDASGNWTFNRDEAGAAHAVTQPVQFVTDDALAYKDRTALIWAGRNNFSPDPEIVKSDIAAMIDYLGHDRYLIGAILTSANDGIDAVSAIQGLNADLAAIYGRRFVDHYKNLRDHGDGSAQDDADIAAGHIPSSLRFDAVHLNDDGYAIVAQGWYDRLLQFGG